MQCLLPVYKLHLAAFSTCARECMHAARASAALLRPSINAAHHSVKSLWNGGLTPCAWQCATMDVDTVVMVTFEYAQYCRIVSLGNALLVLFVLPRKQFKWCSCEDIMEI